LVHVGGVVRDCQLKVALVLPEAGLHVPLEGVGVVDQRLQRGLLVEEPVTLHDERQIFGPREQEAALCAGWAGCVDVCPDLNSNFLSLVTGDGLSHLLMPYGVSKAHHHGD